MRMQQAHTHITVDMDMVDTVTTQSVTVSVTATVTVVTATAMVTELSQATALKKKRAKKHIKECLKKKAYYEQYSAREGILNLKGMSMKETNGKNPGFEITMILYDWDSGIPDKLCKMKINYWCYVKRYVVD